MVDTTFWQTLPRPIIGLSPMDGITDHPYRHIQKKYGHPAVMYTEFTSAEGVCHGADRLLTDFLFDESQRPIIAQIYRTTPDFFRQTAILLCELGFDGIDINMGCPAKNVAHSGAGAALIKVPQTAQQIVAAVKQGIAQWQAGVKLSDCPNISEVIWQKVMARHALLPLAYQQPRPIPVSIKTRLGYDQKITTEWISLLLETQPAAIALHGRTLTQHYSGQADWAEIAKAAELVHQTETVILGNGDVKSLTDALDKTKIYGVDGVLIGRAAMGNPQIFQAAATLASSTSINSAVTKVSPFAIALEHTDLYEKTYADSEKYHFLPMRKHLGWYVRDIPNASQIRIELFQTESSQQVKEVFLKHQLMI